MGFQSSDIAQFDEFIEHAKFHSEQHGDTILVFISKHYGELKAEHQKNHQEEEKDHENLPFNHSSNSNTVNTLAFILDSLKSDVQILDFTVTVESNFYYQVPVYNVHEKGLFQPPRIS
tara:strand:+ start:36112 stop:36465 length:354 start_codon:yes stop_codon:yes gene_type:complete